jgi:hypothetical protein
MLDSALQLKHNLHAADTISDVFIFTALAVPLVLMSFSDTGMFFSVIGAILSAGRGFKRAVGSIK